MANDLGEFRQACLTALVQKHGGVIGRTMLMKLAFFLQTLKAVPLGYRFRLYNYGPYDAQVLDDLEVAQGRGLIDAQAYSFATGYGFALRPGKNARELAQQIAPFEKTIDLVLAEFGNRSAADVEIVSTIIFVDRAAQAMREKIQTKELSNRVRAVKPHIEGKRIDAEISGLKRKQLLAATQ